MGQEHLWTSYNENKQCHLCNKVIDAGESCVDVQKFTGEFWETLHNLCPTCADPSLVE